MTTEKTYVSIAQVDNCKACGKRDDLRFGSCFDCSDFVSGEKVSEVTHKFWDSRAPTNFWFYSEDRN